MPLKIVRKPGRAMLYMRGTINGVRYDESTGTTNRKIAEGYRLKREKQIHDEHLHGTTAIITFGAAVEDYLRAGGSNRFLSQLVECLGDKDVTAIRQEQIDAVARTLMPHVADSTLNRQVYSPVSAVLHHAAVMGWCDKPMIKRPKQPQGRVRWITKDEAQRLLNASSPHMRPLICFLLYTGARAGEALWLDWANLDLERRHVQFVSTKNGASRGVPLHPVLVAELEQLEHRSGAVFRTAKNKPYTKPTREDDTSAGTRIKSGFAGAVRRAGLTDFRPHDCRHTWATWHYQANRDLGALMRLGGWKTMSMVMRYAHTNVEELAHTIDAM